MVRIRLPRWPILVVSLIPPRGPAFARAAREQFEKRSTAARFHDLVLLIRLARVLALACRQEIHLPSPRRERARVPAAHAEQDQLGHVAEIKADAAPVRAAVL